ncbi:MAG: hypothetical protein WAZ27_01835 [Minisyncoccia bacterium]
MKEKRGWKYQPTHPQKEYKPDVDAILVSEEGREDLLIQLTSAAKWLETLAKDVDGKGVPLFDAGLISEAIHAKEEKYDKQGADMSNLILLVYESLHPETVHYDIDSSVHKDTKFRGVYVVSPKFVFSRGVAAEQKTKEEWTFPIKEAF